MSERLEGVGDRSVTIGQDADNSLIVTGDGFTFIQQFGITPDELRVLLKQRERHLSKQLRLASAAERRIVKAELVRTKGALADIQTEFERQKSALAETLTQLDELTKLKATIGIDRLEQAEEALAKKDTALAEGLLQSALEKQAKMVASLALRLAILAAERMDYKKGLIFARRAVNADPSDTSARYERATLARRLGHFDEACEQLLAAMPRLSPATELLENGFATIFDLRRLDLAEVELMLGNKDAAKSILSAYLPYNSQLAEARYFWRGFLLLLDRAGMPRPPVTSPPESDVGVSDEPPQNSDEAAEALNLRGHEAKERGDNSTAMDLFRQARAALPPEGTSDPMMAAIIQINMSDTLTRLRRYEEAEREWRQARVLLGDRHPFVLHSLNNTARDAMDAGAIDTARRWWQTSLDLAIQQEGEFSTPANNIRQYLTQLEAEAGNYTDAISYQQALLEGARSRAVKGLSSDDVDAVRANIAGLEQRIHARDDVDHKSNPDRPPLVRRFAAWLGLRV